MTKNVFLIYRKPYRFVLRRVCQSIRRIVPTIFIPFRFVVRDTTSFFYIKHEKVIHSESINACVIPGRVAFDADDGLLDLLDRRRFRAVDTTVLDFVDRFFPKFFLWGFDKPVVVVVEKLWVWGVGA